MPENILLQGHEFVSCMFSIMKDLLDEDPSQQQNIRDFKITDRQRTYEYTLNIEFNI